MTCCCSMAHTGGCLNCPNSPHRLTITTDNSNHYVTVGPNDFFKFVDIRKPSVADDVAKFHADLLAKGIVDPLLSDLVRDYARMRLAQEPTKL